MPEIALLRMVNCSPAIGEGDSFNALVQITPETAASIRQMAADCQERGYHLIEKDIARPVLLKLMWDDDVADFNQRAAAGDEKALNFVKEAGDDLLLGMSRIVVDGSQFWYRIREKHTDIELETDTIEIADLGPAPAPGENPGHEAMPSA